MGKSWKFWIGVGAFQLAYGAAIVAITRNYYADPAPARVAAPAAATGAALPAADTLAAIATQLGSQSADYSAIRDPVELARLADQSFTARQYDRAVTLYERILELEPTHADTLNNLGLTLHYVGRSREALDRLHASTTVHPEHQRSWLTLGFVTSQLGDVEQARAALTTAIELNTDPDVTQSAQSMLAALP